MTSRVMLFALILLVAAPITAQDEQSKTDQQTKAEALKAFTQEASEGAERSLQMYGVDAFPCDKDMANEQVHKSCLAARQAYYDYYARALPRRTRVYEWNNFSTKVIFVVVLGLVAIGVYFSWKQFFGMTVRPKTEASQDEQQAEHEKREERELVTELEMGLKGIKVKSPILGVILLTVSLAFFYLYLKYVYPVTNNF